MEERDDCQSPQPSTGSNFSWDMCEKGSVSSTRWMVVKSCLSLVGDKSSSESETLKESSSLSSLEALQNISDCESIISSTATAVDSQVTNQSEITIEVSTSSLLLYSDVVKIEAISRHFLCQERQHFISTLYAADVYFRAFLFNIQPVENQFFRLASPHNPIRRRPNLISSLSQLSPFLLSTPPERGVQSRFEGRGRLIMLWYIILPGTMLSVCGFFLISSH